MFFLFFKAGNGWAWQYFLWLFSQIWGRLEFLSLVVWLPLGHVWSCHGIKLMIKMMSQCSVWTVITIFAEWLQTHGQLERHCATCCCHMCMFVRGQRWLLKKRARVCVGLIDPMTLDTRDQPVYCVCILCMYVCDNCACSAVCRPKARPFHTTNLFFGTEKIDWWLLSQGSKVMVLEQGPAGHLISSSSFSIFLSSLLLMCQLMLTLWVFVCVWESPSCLIELGHAPWLRLLTVGGYKSFAWPYNLFLTAVSAETTEPR